MLKLTKMSRQLSNVTGVVFDWLWKAH